MTVISIDLKVKWPSFGIDAIRPFGEIDNRDVPWPWATNGSLISGSSGPHRCGSIPALQRNKNSPYTCLDQTLSRKNYSIPGGLGSAQFLTVDS